MPGGGWASPTYSWSTGAAPSTAGDMVICRVIIDAIVFVAACSTGVAPSERAGSVEVAAALLDHLDEAMAQARDLLLTYQATYAGSA